MLPFCMCWCNWSSGDQILMPTDSPTFSWLKANVLHQSRTHLVTTYIKESSPLVGASLLTFADTLMSTVMMFS